MNSSTHHIINVVIDYSIIILSVINICLSTGIFSFIVYHLFKIKKSPHRVALLLTANMYSALLITTILVLEQYTRVLPEHLYSLISSDDDMNCQLGAYLQWVSLCAIFYSNTLQAIYRLCRVVFYNKLSLQSFRLYQILIIIQWIMCFICILPFLLLGSFKYVMNDYFCQIRYSDIGGILVVATLAYGMPMNITMGLYIYTMKKMRRKTDIMTQIQQITARRNLVVLFRICILLGLLLIIPTPTSISFLTYNFTGYQPWWSIQLQALVLTVIVTIVIVVLALISPHVLILWVKYSHRQHPIAIRPAIIKIN